MQPKQVVKRINAWHVSACCFAMILAFGGAALWGQQETPPVQPQAEQTPAAPSQAPPAAESASEPQPPTAPKAQERKSPLDQLDDLEPRAKAAPPPAQTESLHVLLGQPVMVTSAAGIRRYALADPNIIDLVVSNPNEILIVGKQRGSVSLVVWDAAWQGQQFDINVECEPPAVPDQLQAALSGRPMPGEEPQQETAWVYLVIAGTILVVGGTILGATRHRRRGFSNLGLHALSSNPAATSLGAAAITEPQESPASTDSDDDNHTDGLASLQACDRFMEALCEERRISARLGHTFSVVLVDLDGLEPTSDSDGESKSERALTIAAKLLEARSRQPNVIAEYGKGKFAILLPETNTHQAEILAERLRTSMETHKVLRSRGVTASIGVATYPDHGSVSEEILKLANSGVLLAKKCNGNCVKVLPPAPEPGNAERNERLLEKYFELEAKASPSSAHGTEPDDAGRSSTTTQNSSLLDTVTALAFAVDTKGPYNAGHSQAVSRLAARIAIQAGLSVAEVEETRLAGLLHDIGKLHVPESVCNKPTQLTADEFELMSRHSAWGAEILEPLNLKPIESIVRHHHERFDGKGYPDQLAADKIPLGARIVAVAESFHSMVTDLPYKGACTFEDALAELRRCSGLQFDPKIVMAFLDWIQSYTSSPERQKA